MFFTLAAQKGALEPSGGVSQKKRKAKKRRKSASPPLDAAEVQEQQEQAGERTAPKGEAPIGSGFNKTEAQKRHERFMRQKEEQQIEKYAAKSHQQKVCSFLLLPPSGPAFFKRHKLYCRAIFPLLLMILTCCISMSALAFDVSYLR